MAIFDITYVGDMPYLKLSGGIITGPTTFGSSVTIDEVTAGDLVVTGNISATNNIQANTINGVTVGSNPKFTDTTYPIIGTGTLNTTNKTIIPAINELFTQFKTATHVSGTHVFTVAYNDGGESKWKIPNVTVPRGSILYASIYKTGGANNASTLIASHTSTSPLLACGYSSYSGTYWDIQSINNNAIIDGPNQTNHSILASVSRSGETARSLHLFIPDSVNDTIELGLTASTGSTTTNANVTYDIWIIPLI